MSLPLISERIPLEAVDYDERARNGVWCRMPYPDHPHGCPNYPDCPKQYPDFKTLSGYSWTAITETFDLKAHAAEMKTKHPQWGDRMCRNLLYWQNGVRKRLRDKAHVYARPLFGDIVLELPEACGVNVVSTMKRVGVEIKRNPETVIKVMLVGRKTSV